MRKSLAPLAIAILLSPAARGQESWQDRVLAVPYPGPERRALLELVRQDFETLEFNRSVIRTPLTIGKRRFEHGLGTHSVSLIRIHSPEPLARFSAWIGVDQNERTQGSRGSVVFAVLAGGRELYNSGLLKAGEEPRRVEVDAGGATQLELRVEDGGDNPFWDHADWAEAAVATAEGKTLRLDELSLGSPQTAARYPFSFTLDGKRGDELLPAWSSEERVEKLDAGRTRVARVWSDPEKRLRLRWEIIRHADFPALEWVLHFENPGTADSPIIEDLQALHLAFAGPLSEAVPFRLHRANGAPASPLDFEPAEAAIDEKHPARLGGGGGRSSNQDLPFFKVETGAGSAVVAVGWSGQWKADLRTFDRKHLLVQAGMERTRFRLHPGERVRTPRLLILFREGDTLEANAQFRQLIYRRYAARRDGRAPLPSLFCNTCFTRGGVWLNECNAENQISLIRAYAPLGLEALITDAGWFEGGWPAGAGNWTPRRDAYPEGMGPVAKAAQEGGMSYGLWFEPERVVASTWIYRNHPEWCLKSAAGPQDTYLANFGLPEVQDYFFGVVKGFMELPGFRVYRQDFNMDPLPYWRFNDPPDREGITEIRYLEGLYKFWDRLAAAWPDGLRENCASGGRRIDLETVARFHIHQKTDYWFDDEVDQASLWSLSHYLPNNIVVAHLNRLDEYSFHSTLPSSLCLGWIADAPDFDRERARKLLGRYRELRPLLVGAFYPLLPYSRGQKDWIASQYHRPDLNQGCILAFRRAESPYRAAEAPLHGLDPETLYELSRDSGGEKIRARGAELMKSFLLTIPERRRSEVIVYRKAEE